MWGWDLTGSGRGGGCEVHVLELRVDALIAEAEAALSGGRRRSFWKKSIGVKRGDVDTYVLHVWALEGDGRHRFA